MASTYTDLHFDNILVEESTITCCLLDFEKTGMYSIDYALDTIYHMVHHPTKYAAPEHEKHAHTNDFKHVIPSAENSLSQPIFVFPPPHSPKIL